MKKEEKKENKKREQNQISSKKWNEWLAGLIDGAGKFTLSKSGYANLDILLELRDEKCHIELKQRFGGEIKRKETTLIRYRVHRLYGIRQLIACVNGHIRHPLRKIEFKEICMHYNVEYKEPETLTFANGWLSGYFDAVGLIEFSTEQDQLYLAFRHKKNTMLNELEIQKCLGVNLTCEQNGCSCESVTLYKINKKTVLSLYKYFKKYRLRSSIKTTQILLIPQFYEIQNETKEINDMQVKQKLWKQFFKKWYVDEMVKYESVKLANYYKSKTSPEKRVKKLIKLKFHRNERIRKRAERLEYAERERKESLEYANTNRERPIRLGCGFIR